jgi:hypothetical protein
MTVAGFPEIGSGKIMGNCQRAGGRLASAILRRIVQHGAIARTNMPAIACAACLTTIPGRTPLSRFVTPEKRGAQAKIVGYLNEYLAQQPSGAPKSDTDLKKLARRIVEEFISRE